MGKTAQARLPTTQQRGRGLLSSSLPTLSPDTGVVGFPYHLDLFAQDGLIAQRALAGELVLVIPQETFYDHFGTQRTVGPDQVAEFVSNWENRATRGIRRTRLAVDENHEGPAVGWYTSVEAMPGLGVGARFAWNTKGRDLLEGGGYAYFSPCVYWSIPDRRTREIVYHQLAGGAVTNEPYFGETTALMSLLQPFAKGGATMGNQTPTPPQEEIAQAARGGWRLLQLFGLGGDRLQAGDAIPPVDGAVDATAFTALQTQVTNLAQQAETAQAEIATLTTERDTARTEVAQLSTRVTTVEGQRATQEFSAMVAADFSHLPGDLTSMATHMLWLFGADEPGEKGQRPHYAYFREVLQKADAACAQAYKAKGVPSGPIADAQTAIDTAVDAYMAENKDVSRTDAVSAVLQARPDLYRLYEQGIEKGGGV